MAKVELTARQKAEKEERARQRKVERVKAARSGNVGVVTRLIDHVSNRDDKQRSV